MGTMLHPFKLNDGSVVFLAIAEWLTPKGHRIWHRGITPDLEVELPDGVDLLLPASETDLDSSNLFKCKDKQLLKAIEVIQEQIQSNASLVASARM
jgi:carboxyl-terminal processing protease